MTARDVLKHHGIEVARLALIKREPSRVYRVRSRDGKRFLLRLRGDSQSLTPPVARLQQRWLDAIAHDTDVVAPVVIPLRGEPMQSCDSQQAALFTWVDGRRVGSPQAFLDPKRLAAVGESVATLHRHAERFRIVIPKSVRRFDTDYFFATDFSPLAKRDRELLKRLQARTREAMSDLGVSRRRFGQIHGDLGPANWLFHHGDACPIDFDELGVGNFLFDFVQVLWTHSMWRDYDEHMTRLLTAYERIRPLDEVERRHLRLFETLPLVDWITRTLRANDKEALKGWLAQTLRCIRERASRSSPPHKLT